MSFRNLLRGDPGAGVGFAGFCATVYTGLSIELTFIKRNIHFHGVGVPSGDD